MKVRMLLIHLPIRVTTAKGFAASSSGGAGQLPLNFKEKHKYLKDV